MLFCASFLSLFHQSKRFCPICVSIHLISFAWLSVWFLLGSFWGGRGWGQRWSNNVGGFCPLKFLPHFPRIRKFLSFSLCNVILSLFEEFFSQWELKEGTGLPSSAVPLCDSIWARAAPLCPRGWRLFLPHLREVLSLRVWRCWLGIFSEQWMLRQGSGACAAPICYHGTAPAHGEMPALIGQKCQGKIGSDGRAQFCCKSPALCKNCPLQSCGMQRWAFSICWCSFPSDFPLISLLLLRAALPNTPNKARAGPRLLCLPEHPQLNRRTVPNLASVNDFPCFKNLPGMLWLMMIFHPVGSVYFSHYRIIVLFLK